MPHFPHRFKIPVPLLAVRRFQTKLDLVNIRDHSIFVLTILLVDVAESVLLDADIACSFFCPRSQAHLFLMYKSLIWQTIES